MRIRTSYVAHALNTLCSVVLYVGPAYASAPQATQPAVDARALLDGYCVRCHNDKLQSGGLALSGVDVADPTKNAGVWEKVIRKLRAGMMPPIGQPRPDSVSYRAFIARLESSIDQAAAREPNPGRTETFHRLNRAEYKNAVRDLLTLDVDVSALLPTDDASYGFDNMAGVLKVNESLMERYLSAAQKTSRLAVGGAPPAPLGDVFSPSPEFPQDDHLDGLPFGTRGGTLIRYNFPQDAEYDISVEFMCAKNNVGPPCDPSRLYRDAHQLEVLVDGERVKLFTFDPRIQGDGGAASEPKSERGRARVRVPIKAGPREVAATFLKLPLIEETDSPRVRFDRPFYPGIPGVGAHMTVYQPYVGKVMIAGPFNPQGPGDTPSRRTIFSCRPKAPTRADECAKAILGRLARLAYRRPVTAIDLQSLMTFYRRGRMGGDFDSGIEIALRALLMSPEFLFRVEAEPAKVVAGSHYRIRDLELASRLSFFLWSSIPDDELLTTAISGRLKNPAVLEEQVLRMLADSRSDALTFNFASQWLQLRRLDGIRPVEALFPNFDEGLRQAARRETELFFDSVLREGRSAVELLTADYTFMNERLARHYGVPGVVNGSHFRRVTLADTSPRRGLLGQASMLMLTSQAIRTSPVVRGKWILETILGTPPPDPPANVPPLAEKARRGTVLTMRERMAEHRANPVCASCHSMMDPLGFALENFDAVGHWRDMEVPGQPIDASGTFPDGTKFNDLSTFRLALTQRPERFVTTLTERLLTFALGRGTEYYDMPAVRKIVRESASTNYRLSSIVLGVVKSAPFQMRTAGPATISTVAVRGTQQ